MYYGSKQKFPLTKIFTALPRKVGVRKEIFMWFRGENCGEENCPYCDNFDCQNYKEIHKESEVEDDAE